MPGTRFHTSPARPGRGGRPGESAAVTIGSRIADAESPVPDRRLMCLDREARRAGGGSDCGLRGWCAPEPGLGGLLRRHRPGRRHGRPDRRPCGRIRGRPRRRRGEARLPLMGRHDAWRAGCGPPEAGRETHRPCGRVRRGGVAPNRQDAAPGHRVRRPRKHRQRRVLRRRRPSDGGPGLGGVRRDPHLGHPP